MTVGLTNGYYLLWAAVYWVVGWYLIYLVTGIHLWRFHFRNGVVLVGVLLTTSEAKILVGSMRIRLWGPNKLLIFEDVDVDVYDTTASKSRKRRLCDYDYDDYNFKEKLLSIYPKKGVARSAVKWFVTHIPTLDVQLRQVHVNVIRRKVTHHIDIHLVRFDVTLRQLKRVQPNLKFKVGVNVANTTYRGGLDLPGLLGLVKVSTKFAVDRHDGWLSSIDVRVVTGDLLVLVFHFIRLYRLHKTKVAHERLRRMRTGELSLNPQALHAAATLALSEGDDTDENTHRLAQVARMFQLAVRSIDQLAVTLDNTIVTGVPYLTMDHNLTYDEYFDAGLPSLYLELLIKTAVCTLRRIADNDAGFEILFDPDSDTPLHLTALMQLLTVEYATRTKAGVKQALEIVNVPLMVMLTKTLVLHAMLDIAISREAGKEYSFDGLSHGVLEVYTTVTNPIIDLQAPQMAEMIYNGVVLRKWNVIKMLLRMTDLLPHEVEQGEAAITLAQLATTRVLIALQQNLPRLDMRAIVEKPRVLLRHRELELLVNWSFEIFDLLVVLTPGDLLSHARGVIMEPRATIYQLLVPKFHLAQARKLTLSTEMMAGLRVAPKIEVDQARVNLLELAGLRVIHGYFSDISTMVASNLAKGRMNHVLNDAINDRIELQLAEAALADVEHPVHKLFEYLPLWLVAAHIEVAQADIVLGARSILIPVLKLSETDTPELGKDVLGPTGQLRNARVTIEGLLATLSNWFDKKQTDEVVTFWLAALRMKHLGVGVMTMLDDNESEPLPMEGEMARPGEERGAEVAPPLTTEPMSSDELDGLDELDDEVALMHPNENLERHKRPSVCYEGVNTTERQRKNSHAAGPGVETDLMAQPDTERVHEPFVTLEGFFFGMWLTLDGEKQLVKMDSAIEDIQVEFDRFKLFTVIGVAHIFHCFVFAPINEMVELMKLDIRQFDSNAMHEGKKQGRGGEADPLDLFLVVGAVTRANIVLTLTPECKIRTQLAHTRVLLQDRKISGTVDGVRVLTMSPTVKDWWSRLLYIDLLAVECELDNPEVFATTRQLRMMHPNQLIVYKIFDNLLILVKVIKHFVTAIKNQHQADKVEREVFPHLQEPIKLPPIELRTPQFSLLMEDDPFELELGMIYQLGLVEQRKRLELHSLFEARVRGMEVADPEEDPHDIEHEFAEELYELRRLMALLWIRKVHAYKKQLVEQTVTNKRYLYGNESSVFKLDDVVPYSIHAPLLKILLNGVVARVEPPLFGLGEVNQFIHDQGQGVPLDMQYLTLVPMWALLLVKLLRLHLRDYPLPLMVIPQAKQAANPDDTEPGFELRGNLVIGEEYTKDKACLRQVYCPFVDGADTDQNQYYGLLVYKTLAAPKLYFDMGCAVKSEGPARFVWGSLYEFALAQVGLNFDQFSKPPVDPLAPLGIWDKMKFIMHGKFKIEVRNRLEVLFKGLRDPYNVFQTAAGFILLFANNIVWHVNPHDDLRLFLHVKAEKVTWYIPNYLLAPLFTWAWPMPVWLPAAKEIVTLGFGISLIPLARVKNWRQVAKLPVLERVVVQLSGGIDFTLGFLLQRSRPELGHAGLLPPKQNGGGTAELQQAQPDGAPEDGHATTECLNHWEVALVHPDYTKDSKQHDLYAGYRLDFVHMKIALNADRDTLYNTIHLLPYTFRVIFDWWHLFALNMMLPIKKTLMFGEGKKPLPKFSQHLVLNLFEFHVKLLWAAHIFRDDASQITDGNDRIECVGLRGKIDEFVVDFHQKRQPVTIKHSTLGRELKVQKMQFNVGQILLDSIDLRTIKATFKQNVYETYDAYQAGVPQDGDEGPAINLSNGTNEDSRANGQSNMLVPATPNGARDSALPDDEAMARELYGANAVVENANAKFEPKTNHEANGAVEVPGTVELPNGTVETSKMNGTAKDKQFEKPSVSIAAPTTPRTPGQLAFGTPKQDTQTPRLQKTQRLARTQRSNRTQKLQQKSKKTPGTFKTYDDDDRWFDINDFEETDTTTLRNTPYEAEAHPMLFTRKFNYTRDTSKAGEAPTMTEADELLALDPIHKCILKLRNVYHPRVEAVDQRLDDLRKTKESTEAQEQELHQQREHLKAKAKKLEKVISPNPGLKMESPPTVPSNFNNRFVMVGTYFKWNQGVRNGLLRYIHYIQYYLYLKRYLLYELVKKIEQMIDGVEEDSPESLVLASIHREKCKLTSRFSRHPLVGTAAMDLASLMGEMHDTAEFRLKNFVELFSLIKPLQMLKEDYLIEMINPQFQVFSDADPRAVCLVAAPEIKCRIGLVYNKNDTSINASELETRYGVEMLDALIFVVQKNKSTVANGVVDAANSYGTNSQWPPWLGVEVFADPHWAGTEQLLVENFSAIVNYDDIGALSTRVQGDDESTDLRTLAYNRLHVDVPQLVINLTLVQYFQLYLIFLDLFSYTDPGMAMVNDKLEKLQFSTYFEDLNTLRDRLEGFHRNRAILNHLQRNFYFRQGNLDNELLNEYLFLKGQMGDLLEDVYFTMLSILLGDYATGGSRTKTVQRWQFQADEIILHLLEDNRTPLVDVAFAHNLFVRRVYEDGLNHNRVDIAMMQLFNLLPQAPCPMVIAPYLETLAGSLDGKSLISGEWTVNRSVGGIKMIESVNIEAQPLQIMIDELTLEKMLQFALQTDLEGVMDLPVLQRAAEKEEENKEAEDEADSELPESSLALKLGKLGLSRPGISLLWMQMLELDDLNEMMKRSKNYFSVGKFRVSPVTVLVLIKLNKGYKRFLNVHDFVVNMPEFVVSQEITSMVEIGDRLKKELIKTLLAHIGRLLRNKMRRTPKLAVKDQPLRQIRSYQGFVNLSDLLRPLSRTLTRNGELRVKKERNEDVEVFK